MRILEQNHWIYFYQLIICRSQKQSTNLQDYAREPLEDHLTHQTKVTILIASSSIEFAMLP